jgi:hypothetical protein
MIRVLTLAFGLLLAGTVGAASARADGPAPIDVVFDVDWTLVSGVDPGTPVGGAVVEFEGQKYRIGDGVAEALNLLRSRPHARISFFSGGKKARNEAILRKIVLDPKRGTTALDVAYRNLAFEDLHDLGGASGSGARVRFAERYRKDLTPFFPDLSRTILVDDVASFAFAGQEANLLWLGTTYAWFASWADVLAARKAGSVDPRYLPPTREAWLADLARIPVSVLTIDAAISAELAEPGSSEPFVSRVARAARVPKAVYLDRWKARSRRGSDGCPGVFEAAIGGVPPHENP